MLLLLLLLLLLLPEETGYGDEAVVGRMVVGKVEGVVGKVDVVVDVEVNGVVEGEAVVVVLGCFSDSIDLRVCKEKQVP